ncbi:MAG: hypothetical protein MUC91_01735 [Verrucomicrobia bacterium]|nr:hypothetical protein [Verrucomicrobiota bacterium]
MNKLLTPSVLSLLVGASAMASVILCVMHIRSIQGTQQQLLAVQRNQAMMNGLVADLYAYGKTNSAIRPLLDSIRAKPVQP